jgi:hypothetical protein
MPTTVLWALSGSNSPWRPCYLSLIILFGEEKGSKFTFSFRRTRPMHLLDVLARDQNGS